MDTGEAMNGRVFAIRFWVVQVQGEIDEVDERAGRQMGLVEDGANLVFSTGKTPAIY
jgi:hypothetical protein